jgi:excisionase family DNA binding protein
MTSNELRQIIADGLEGAAERLRLGIVAETEPKRGAPSSPVVAPLSDVTEHVLRVDDAARILGVSTWSVYEAIKAGEMPAIHVGRRILIPTHALREWMSASGLDRA